MQYFPTAHLKIEPWFINGWQSYGRFNNKPGLGGQIKWTPRPWLNIVSNNYGMGRDDLGYQHRARLHTDNSIEVKYYDNASKFLDKAALSFTADAGCEFGDGVAMPWQRKTNSHSQLSPDLAEAKLHRIHGLQPHLVQEGSVRRYHWRRTGKQPRSLSGIGPTHQWSRCISGTPYFPGPTRTRKSLPFKAWDGSITFDYMPKQYITMRTEYGYRHSDSPYFAGHGGSTPPGGNNGQPGQFACITGAASGATDVATAEANCGGPGWSDVRVWFPDLRRDEQKLIFALMVKF